MDFSGPGVTYAFMIIPSAFVVVVIIQGIEKVVKHEQGGTVGIIFGILFLLLIVAAYFLYIK
jgi:hypothetical protein